MRKLMRVVGVGSEGVQPLLVGASESAHRLGQHLVHRFISNPQLLVVDDVHQEQRLLQHLLLNLMVSKDVCVVGLVEGHQQVGAVEKHTENQKYFHGFTPHRGEPGGTMRHANMGLKAVLLGCSDKLRGSLAGLQSSGATALCGIPAEGHILPLQRGQGAAVVLDHLAHHSDQLVVCTYGGSRILCKQAAKVGQPQHHHCNRALDQLRLRGRGQDSVEPLRGAGGPCSTGMLPGQRGRLQKLLGAPRSPDALQVRDSAGCAPPDLLVSVLHRLHGGLCLHPHRLLPIHRLVVAAKMLQHSLRDVLADLSKVPVDFQAGLLRRGGALDLCQERQPLQAKGSDGVGELNGNVDVVQLAVDVPQGVLQPPVPRVLQAEKHRRYEDDDHHYGHHNRGNHPGLGL
eukprot:RCo015017